MRRAVLALAIATGLAIGSSVPTAAIGETQVTLSCDDGTSTTLQVDAATLTGLIQAVQAMIDYPAGLTCTLVKVPLLSFGTIALASPGQNPFIVGGGRWQVSCASIGLGGGGGAAPGGTIARVPGSWSSLGGAQIDDLVWVNIAVNFHQRDDTPPTFFGTLNETIPANQSCPGGQTSESHFTSKPIRPFGCFVNDGGRASVRSYVTEQSGAPFQNAALNTPITFTFMDNGNPSNSTDMLQGPPVVDFSDCPVLIGDANFELLNGNISVHQ
jgi:hypothetical protein